MTTLPLDDFLKRGAESPMALAQLAGVFHNMGNKTRARELAMQATAAAPDDPEIRSLVAVIFGNAVPRWHFDIVRDEARNAAYEAALKRAVTPQTKVLEIGTGTGILAMMAARAGAKNVITCERVPAIAGAASEIVARNGFAGQVRVLEKKSFDLDPETDLGGRADLLVSEIISNTLLSEGVLGAVEHAAKALLRPGAKIIPARGIVRVALAHYAESPLLGTIDGFDLSPFNRLAGRHHPVRRGNAGLRLMSAPADLFDFDFQSGGPFPPAHTAITLLSNGGEANGIAQWIALKLDEENWCENDPDRGSLSSWPVMLWPFIAARNCPEGTAVTVRGSHDRMALRLWAEA